MNCHKCGKENHEGSKFCRFCGNKLSEKKHIKPPLSPKVLVVIILILIIIGASIVYAAPKVIDYRNVFSKRPSLKLKPFKRADNTNRR